MSEPFTGNRIIEFLRWSRNQKYFQPIEEEEFPTMRTKDDLVKRVMRGDRCSEREAIEKVDRALTAWNK